MSEITGLPPAETSPASAIPLPISTPFPPEIPTPQALQRWLPLYLSKTDSVLNHLSKLVSTPSGIDVLLCTVGYSSLLASNLLSRLSVHQIQQTARLLIEKAITLPPNTTIVLSPATLPIPSNRLLVLATRFKALSALITDFRTFGRLWGLLAIYKWAKVTWNSPPKDTFIRKIVQIQVLANLVFQTLENGAYLSSKNILPWDKTKQAKAGIWSVRCWMVHVLLDIVKLGIEYGNRDKDLAEMKGEKEKEHREWMERWKKSLIVNLAYAPLTMHWSTEGGLVTEFWVGLLGTVAGGTSLRYLWKNTQ
ncbi:93cc8f81-9989-4c4b-a2eb-35aef874e1f3-CDS [Sclerotinia trifoliorum]|uniref:93cc8f81-9989-4c4b-a2eb-35aef874e1f3-CDS n=1 Tax=Sclerotinia trifoliorum TaxID=28548 RepID=A0A8H2VT07_9HELO|nr:93cc8f81-9989-4c4b-a2eb-35aef874e1f3-CDS [Sclerotinia trifoliorum]